ncbi:MAG TPA: menaquinone biosynthesis protein [Bacteroidia bacterium]|nr:menaquinone biosynthesis protein [Bacteroidia bacterium]
MEKRYSVSIVKYTNTLPLRYGIKNSQVINEIDLQLDIPAVCAQKLLEDKVDIGLIPVAIIPLLKEYHIISNYCIGSNERVDTVKLYSNVPLNEIENVYLDYQSRTSIMLAKVLCKNFWKISPKFINAEAGFETKTTNKDAAVVIGDRCFSLNGTFTYEYDLAFEWKKFTTLPFVFAAWVSNKKIDAGFIENMENAMAHGIKQVDVAIKEDISIKDPGMIKKYLTERINYNLDEAKKKSLHLFLDLIQQL